MVGCEGFRAMLLGKSGGGEELGAFYPIRPECQEDAPRTRFKPRVRLYASCFLLDTLASISSIPFEFPLLMVTHGVIFFTHCSCDIFVVIN